MSNDYEYRYGRVWKIGWMLGTFWEVLGRRSVQGGSRGLDLHEKGRNLVVM